MRKPPKASKSAQTGIDIQKLASAFSQQFGPGAGHIPGDDPDYMISRIKNWIDVGRFNEVLGHEAFGIPCGYYTEIAGAESAGKSTLCYALIAWAQSQDYVTMLADIEHSYDPVWASKQGIDPKRLLIIEAAYERSKKVRNKTVQEYLADSVDDQFKKYEMITKKSWELYKTPQLLVVDSVAAILPKEQLEGDYGERSVGALARALAVNMPKFHTVMLSTQTACVFINQLRDKIGVIYGSKEGTPGGRAKNFYYSSRVSIKRVKTDKKGEKPIGITSRITNMKNKIGSPFRKVEMQINFETGIV